MMILLPIAWDGEVARARFSARDGGGGSVFDALWPTCFARAAPSTTPCGRGPPPHVVGRSDSC
jgi:hypothetical protein